MVGSFEITGTVPEPIAIIGIGCRYPQAASARELWSLLMRSGDAIDSYAEKRFSELDSFYEAAQKKSGASPLYRGGFLPSIDLFDAQLFEMSPREAMYMDPQHRLLLEVAYEALEDAGQTSEHYRGSRTAVFTGLWTSDFESHLYHYADSLDFYVMTGGGRAPASGRLSFTFGFEGPSLTVDAACSSSLVAVHLACRSLQSGETNMALAGGANIILGTNATQLFGHASMLSKDGHCKFGDARADGFVRSEGAGMVVLKRLSDAIAANDPIYAVIRGSAVNNDGRTNGLMMTPSVEGQRNLLLEGWRAAGIDPRNIRYLEAHGTGTSAGDPVEIEAFGSALLAAGVTEPRCYMGSIKTNIGHTESAAGVAGLIKVAMAMRKRVIPPSLHFEEPSPKVDWANLPVQVLIRPLDLAASEDTMLAGISSFGLTGTNAHILVSPFPSNNPSATCEEAPMLFATSAHSPEAINSRLRDVAALLRDATNTNNFVDICYTSSARRTLHDFRFAAVAESKQALAEKIEAHLALLAVDGVVAGRRPAGERRVVFVAPGQGSQSLGMARELLASEPVFRAALERCAAAIAVETGWSLLDRAFGAYAEESLTEIDVIQPALFAVSVALAELWRSRGGEPCAIVGHSMGEVAAAHIAGILSLEDAAAVICRRSRLMKSIGGSGAMATVELPLDEMLTYTEPSNGRISVAASNSPGTTVISGEPEAIDDLLSLLELKDIFCRRIKVDVASHSAQVDPILFALVSQLDGLRPTETQLPMLSTVTGKQVAGIEMGAEYWRQNLRQPVLFARAIETLAQDGCDCFIELSPHPILLPAIESTLRSVRPDAVAVASLRRGQSDASSLLLSMGALFVAGYPVKWSQLYPPSARCVELPGYPFQRESYWPDAATLPRSNVPTLRKDPLIGTPFQSSMHASAVLWNVDLDLARLPYLNDHRVRELVVLPASAHIECALEAVRSLQPEEAFDVADLVLSNALSLSESEKQEIQIALVPLGKDRYTFEISSRSVGDESGWTVNSTGRLVRHQTTEQEPNADLSLKNDGHAGYCSAEEHYRTMAKGGIRYGPAFRLWSEGWTDGQQALSRIQNPGQDDASANGYLLHPALLDACFQSISQVSSFGGDFDPEDTYLPVAIERLRLYRALPIEGDLFVRTRLSSGLKKEGTIALDLRVSDSTGDVLFEVTRLQAQRLQNKSATDVSDLLFQLEWVPEARVTVTSPHDLSDQHWAVFCAQEAEGPTGIPDWLARFVASRGGMCTLVSSDLKPGTDFHKLATGSAGAIRTVSIDPTNSEHLAALFTAFDRPPITAVLHLSGLDSIDGEQLTTSNFFALQEAGVQLLPRIVQTLLEAELSPRLWMITTGAIVVDASLSVPTMNSSTTWGMGTAIAREHPELQACLIDLSPAPGAEELDRLTACITENEDSDRVALRGGLRFVPHIVRYSAPFSAPVAAPLREGQEYRVAIDSPGSLENLHLQALARHAPAAGEVAIEILAAGLNFIDVLRVMGIYPGLDPTKPLMLGMECAGRIVAVGEDVVGWQIGDKVVAVTPNPESVGFFASYVTIPAELAVRKPEHLSMAEAAVIPLAYMTAYYSLIKLAQVARGEWVLIHSGAGGVGLAAIEIALASGAHVIATASTPEKHTYLKSIGVSHVFDSRSLAFSEEVLALTAGRGVDIVVNSLTGDFVVKSLETLAPYGRFIELGKRDIYEDRRIGLKVFRKNISYHAVDLAALGVERRAYFAEMLRHVVQQVQVRAWRALPVECLSASDPTEPFRRMAAGRHIGRFAMSIDRLVSVLPATEQALFSSDATYLITGGLGGVGSGVAEWMALHGARHLVLVSRRPSSEETEAVLNRIRAAGANVLHTKVNVADGSQVLALVDRIRKEMPPLRGIMHTAAAIDDVLIRDLTPERYATAIDAKIRGALHLHEATKHDNLDFCVYFSSIAAIYPQPGVGSYAAANLFLDSFARYRRAHGLAATSVNWGGWENTGLAREAGTSRSISGYGEQGILTFTLAEGLKCLETALLKNPVQLLTFRIETEKFVAFHEPLGVPPLFNILAKESASVRAGSPTLPEIQALLAGASSEKQSLEILEEYLQQQLGKVLRLAAERIDCDRAFGTIGLDSLMGLEFVRRINAGLGITLSATAVFNYPTIRQLSRHVSAKMQLNRAHPELAEPTISEKSVQPPASVASMDDDISEDDAIRALMELGDEHLADAMERGRA